jgi:hypothetical protein
MALKMVGVPVVCVYCAREAENQKHGGPLPVAPMHFIPRPELKTDTYKYTVIRSVCSKHQKQINDRGFTYV